MTTFHVPQGPVTLNEHLFNSRTGSFFRVTDTRNKSYSLKVFSYVEEMSIETKKENLAGFASDRSTLVKVTKAVCPALLTVVKSEEPTISCSTHHLQVALGVDVSVQNADGARLESVLMPIANSAGRKTERRVDFTANTLLPLMSGRLGDIVDEGPEFTSIISRYAAYTTIAPQLVEAVKRLHEIGVGHLSIDASTVACLTQSCEQVVLGEFGRSVLRMDPESFKASVYGNELMQESVRFMAFDPHPKVPSLPAIISKFASYRQKALDWDAARKVDWYGLGGTLYYVVAGNRLFADVELPGHKSSRSVAELVLKTMNDTVIAQHTKGDIRSQKTLVKLREKLAEGLLLVDGLLSVDRRKRVSFDSDADAKQVISSLRASKAAMSVLQTDSKRKTGSASVSFASFLQDTQHDLPELRLGDGHPLPSFIQAIC